MKAIIFSLPFGPSGHIRGGVSYNGELNLTFTRWSHNVGMPLVARRLPPSAFHRPAAKKNRQSRANPQKRKIALTWKTLKNMRRGICKTEIEGNVTFTKNLQTITHCCSNVSTIQNLFNINIFSKSASVKTKSPRVPVVSERETHTQWVYQ